MKLVTLIAVVALASTPAPALSQNANVTKDNYTKVKIGMPLKQVQEILGPEKEMAQKNDVQSVAWENTAERRTTTIKTTFLRGVLEKKEIEIKGEDTSLVGGLLGGGIGFIVCGGLSLLLLVSAPIGIALYRSHPDLAAIAIIAIFFSWTGIGWWIALIWAVKSIPQPSTVNVNIGGPWPGNGNSGE